MAVTTHTDGADRRSAISVVIIGAGAAGIAMGCQLKRKLGFNDFRIFDRQAGIGGIVCFLLITATCTYPIRYLVD
jgi:NADPH-dependent glutamate synthase beta subunit-like oxidoreductase